MLKETEELRITDTVEGFSLVQVFVKELGIWSAPQVYLQMPDFTKFRYTGVHYCNIKAGDPVNDTHIKEFIGSHQDSGYLNHLREMSRR